MDSDEIKGKGKRIIGSVTIIIQEDTDANGFTK